MSAFTDYCHEWALRETLFWQGKTPTTEEEWYRYGEYRYRLFEYDEAVAAYQKAMKNGSISATFRLAYLLRCFQVDIRIKTESFFKVVIGHDLKCSNPKALYRMGICYSYGYGQPANSKKGFAYFQKAQILPEAKYELGLFYTKAGNRLKAEDMFRQAYDGFVESAIFRLFDLYGQDLPRFPYVREIKEAYSFHLGRLMRAAHLHPAAAYWKRLADFYRRGYPGDGDEQKRAFIRLADQYEKRAVESAKKPLI